MNSTSAMIKKFYEVLFEPGETTCFSETAFGTSVYHVDDIQNTYPNYQRLMYFSVNALHTHRFDCNVTSYRNFLIENDKIATIPEQIALVKKIGMPFSTVTYSGGKSVHFIISLESPLPDESTYRFVADWIHNIINVGLLTGEPDGPGDFRFDHKTKNPSRFTRVPGGTNVKYVKDEEGEPIKDENGRYIVKSKTAQSLVTVKGRVPDSVMQEWLLAHPQCMPVKKKYDKVVANDCFNPLLLKKWSTFLLDNGINQGKRNNSFFEMGFDFIQAGASLDEAIKYIFDEAKHMKDFPFSEVESAVRSAYKTYERDRNATTRSNN